MRKIVSTLPFGMPETHLRKALGHIHSDRTRARVESRIRRREGAR
jgi:hypothetical protein